MLLTIHNLPPRTQYNDVKDLILSKCGLKESIIDNLVNEGNGMKVTVGVLEEEDAALVVRKINGLYFGGQQLYVENKKQKKESEQPYRKAASLQESQFMMPQPLQPQGFDFNPQLQQMSMGMYNYAMYTPQAIGQTIPNTFMAYGNQGQSHLQPMLAQYGGSFADFSQQGYNTPAHQQQQLDSDPYTRMSPPAARKRTNKEAWDDDRHAPPLPRSPPRPSESQPQSDYRDSRFRDERRPGGFDQPQDRHEEQAPRQYDDARGFDSNAYDSRDGQASSRGGHASSRGGYDSRGGHDSRGGYNDFRGGKTSSRGGYNDSRGGHASSRGGYNDSRGGHASRGGYNDSRGGHNDSRGGHNDSRGGHASSRGGYNDSRGGHASRGGYNDSRGGHASRGGYNDSRGGHASRGGYNDSRGGHASRGGYNDSRGGHASSRGGYDDSRSGDASSRGGYDSRGGRASSRGGYNDSRGGDASSRGGYDSRGGLASSRGGYDSRGGHASSRGGYDSRGGHASRGGQASSRGGYNSRGGQASSRGGYDSRGGSRAASAYNPRGGHASNAYDTRDGRDEYPGNSKKPRWDKSEEPYESRPQDKWREPRQSRPLQREQREPRRPQAEVSAGIDKAFPDVARSKLYKGNINRGLFVILFDIAKNLNLMDEMKVKAHPIKAGLKRIILTRLHEIAGKEILEHGELHKLYRSHYPRSDDFVLHDTVLRTIAEEESNPKPDKPFPVKQVDGGFKPKPINSDGGMKPKPINSGPAKPVEGGPKPKPTKSGPARPAEDILVRLKPKKTQHCKPPPVLPGKIPSYVGGDKRTFKIQKRQNEKDMTTLETYAVTYACQLAMEAEVHLIGELFKKQFEDPQALEDWDVYRSIDQEDLINQCKKLIMHHLSRRISNSGLKLVRIFGRPKPPSRVPIEQYLMNNNFGCISLKKSVKAPYFTAEFDNYEVVDRLVNMDPVKIGSCEIYFKYMHVGVKTPKRDFRQDKQLRKRYVASLIDTSEVNLLDKDWKIQEQKEEMEKETELRKIQEEEEEMKKKTELRKIQEQEAIKKKAKLRQDQEEAKKKTELSHFPESDDVIYMGAANDLDFTVDITGDDEYKVEKKQVLAEPAEDAEFLHEDFQVIDEVRGSDNDLHDESANEDEKKKGGNKDDWDETGEDWGDVVGDGNNSGHNGDTGKTDDNIGEGGNNDKDDEENPIEGDDGDGHNDGDIDWDNLNEDDLEDY